ncbi:MAG: hypothetical protein WBZ37_10915 [Mycobacterium sp.]
MGIRRAASAGIRYHLTPWCPDKLDLTGQFWSGPSKHGSAGGTVSAAAANDD